MTKPLVSDPPRDNEPDRVLNSEECSERLEARPSEAVNALGKPLLSDPEIESEPVKDLARPLISEPAIESEPEIDLRNENFSAVVEDRPREPIKALPRPLV